MRETQLPKPQQCWSCGYTVTDASAAVKPDATPSDGDYSLCIKCGQMSVFTKELELREPTLEEHIAIARDRDCQLAKAAWRAMKREGHMR